LDEEILSLAKNVNSEINGIISRIQGINNTSSKISLQNLTNTEISSMNENNHGTKISLLPNQISLQNVGEFCPPGGSDIYYAWVNLGGGGTDVGISIESDNDIILKNRSGGQGLSVKSDSVEIFNINGIKISYDTTKITLTDYTNTKVAYIPWESD
jgi:hypothetical protein